MDEIVLQAIAKWPKVPACYGWLGLDARGNWYMRDDQAQAAGPFAAAAPGASAAGKGSLLLHEKLIDFIQRNYESDATGQWFFQNGPQRVYVELEATPLIWRVDAAPAFAVAAHTGQPARVQRCLMDELGRLYLETNLGFGLVHTQDMTHAADAVERGLWVPQEESASVLPARFGYVRSPELLQKK
ncbi:Protein of unknown function [Polaromonas sp. OV174]|uniref:DUF2946 family protein n=1 Tax=Polaromonas sp. OV174 TaxID=1855300 RepID=UPI0008F0FCF6|nr:DUF2946 family protein [Polaromonas sp. OV174]SFC08025.1 Protein of unknown function [Polaromonas sp. OV174]